MRPPYIVGHLRGVIDASGVKQDVSQPACIADLEIESVSKHPGFVTTARVGRTEAVLLGFAHIENGPVAARQAAHRDRPRSDLRHRRVEQPEHRLPPALPLVDRERPRDMEELPARRDQALAQRRVGGAEGHRLERGAVARGERQADMAVADRLGIGDPVRREGEDRLGMAGAEGPGPLDQLDQLDRGAARGQRRVDGQAFRLGRSPGPCGRAPPRGRRGARRGAPARSSGRPPWRGRRP